MALPPFLAYTLPIFFFILAEAAFIFLFCRKKRLRIDARFLMPLCLILTVFFIFISLIITSSRTEVWIVNPDYSCSHKYVIKRTGEYAEIGHENFYIMNYTDQTFYYNTKKVSMEIPPKLITNIPQSLDETTITKP